MERLSSFPCNHEIIEIEHDDMKPPGSYRGIHPSKSEIRTEERDENSLASHVSRISSLEDDLNQLFEIFNRRASSRMGARHHQNGAGSSKKNASKRPIGNHGSSSPNGSGFSDKVNLKQALRGLCISQASEMAATRRSSKLGGSSGVGRITTMYRNVVVEDGSLTTSQDGFAKSSLPEISFISEQQSVNSLQRSPESPVVVPHFPSSKYTAALDEGVRSNSEIQKLKRALKPSEARVAEVKLADFSKENSPSLSSFTLNHSPDRTVKSGQSSPAPDIRTFTRTEPKSRSSMTQISPKERPLSSVSSSPQAIHDNLQTRDRNCQIESELCVSDESPSPTSLAKFYLKAHHAPLPSTSYSTEESSSLEKGTTITSRTEITQPSSSSGSKEKSLKMDKLHKEVQPPPESPLPLYRSDLSGNDSWETRKSATAPYLPVNTETMVKPGRLQDKGSVVKEEKKGYLKKSDKSTKGISNTKPKAGKGVSRLVKPVIKTRNYVKRKSKKDPKNPPYSSINNTHSEFNNILYPGSDHVICPKCHCVVSEAWEEAEEGDDGDSQLSPFASPINDFSPASFMGSATNGFSSASPIGSPINGFSPASRTVVPSAEIFPISPIVSPKAETSSDFAFSDSGRPSYKLGIISKPQEVVEPEVGNNSKSRRDKGEFTQSSKSSPDECSTSTSNSGESHSSRPSFCDRPHMSKDVRWQAIRQVRIEHGSLGLRNFNLLKKLGCGDIGTVYLAELIGTNCLFAIKVMDNDFLARRNKIARAQAEREILRMLDHPFLPTLYCQFTSDNLSCLVMEYCPGGDLHVLRQRQPGRCFTEQAARFYVAEVLLALEYLHMLGVVYRDLKPENILVREDGHIMLSDFDLSLRCAVNPTLLVTSSTSESANTSNVKAASAAASCAEPFCIQKPSCRVTCFGPRVHSRSKPRKLKAELVDPFRLLPLLIAEPTAARSNSFVGTHEYLAPEIIKGEGHGSAVDWWTFGIFLYELLYGRTPFRGASNEETLANVVLESLRFPDFPLVSLQARDLIVCLLVKEPEGRLGTERGAAEIKQHPFFEGLNWALIRCAVPPELPEARSYGAGHANESSYDQVGSHSNNYLEYDDSTGDHVEFEVF